MPSFAFKYYKDEVEVKYKFLYLCLMIFFILVCAGVFWRINRTIGSIRVITNNSIVIFSYLYKQ